MSLFPLIASNRSIPRPDVAVTERQARRLRYIYRGITLITFSVMVISILACSLPAYSAERPPSAICIDAETGLVLYEQNADMPRPPASMVKMMLMLMVAEGLERGDWSLETKVTVSRNAQRMGGSQAWLAHGEVYPLGHLMALVAVASANDGAMAVADGLWGSETAYLADANHRAKELGMTDSEFHSVHGLPPSPGERPDKTTARDMAQLARHCVRKPIIMEWVGQKEVRLDTNGFHKTNTNKLLWRMDDCDGLKTGWTCAAGFCLTATARRNNVRLIVVVMGQPSRRERFVHARRLLESCFSQVRRVRVVRRGDLVGEPIAVSSKTPDDTIRLSAAEDLWVTVKPGDIHRLRVQAIPGESLNSTLNTGGNFGEVRVLLAERILASGPLTVSPHLSAILWPFGAGSE